MHTKKDYEQLMMKLLNPLKPYYSYSNAYLKVGNTSALYRDKAALIEGFARPLWALAPYYADQRNKDDEFAKIYREGFKNGTNPFHPDYWGELPDYDQVMVEMAPMGLALLLAPETFFNPLSDEEKRNLAEWLYAINDHPKGTNNWIMFQVLVNIGLKNVGMPYSEEKIEEAIARIDELYMGDGWYCDGRFADGTPGQTDYYIAFAIHFYSLIYAKYIEKAYPDRSNRLKERAAEFAKHFIFWFAESGEAIPYGRSQTYRFAQVSFWSALVWADASPFPLGVVKGIINRHLNDWVNAPIFDNAGILTIGYKYPNIIMSETYNAPGSPYWSMKAFLMLALPDDHEFFTCEEEPLPELEEVHPIEAIGAIVTNNRYNAVLYPHTRQGLWHEPAKYAKFAYSSKFGFSIPRAPLTFDAMAPDSQLSFKIGENTYVSRYAKSSTLLPNKRIKIEWSPIEGIEVETIITPYGNAHKREHTIKAAFSCEAVDAGFAVPWQSGAAKEQISEGEASVISSIGGCRVYSEYGDGIIINAAVNTNLIHSQTRIPAVLYKIPIGESKISCMVYELQEK
ncbi:MAG: DUF2264 domain-containing protein [Clostridia bacterium]|nr:DUF2264 domain-containing protein [Clostridia bacterium]